MEMKKIYFFRRYNDFGFDEIKILAFTEYQAILVLEETVKDFENWYLQRIYNLEFSYNEFFEE
jgi:hypothetical protein